MPATEPRDRTGKPGSRRLVAPLFFAVLAFTVLVALGTWQLQRLAWKEALIAAAGERAGAAAVDLPPPAGWPGLDLADHIYRKVTLTGRFRHDDEIHVYTALTRAKGAHDGQGYWVMTPLERDDGTIVFVNRGFVPLDFKAPETRAAGQIEGRVTVTGLLRAPEPRGRFTVDDDRAKNVWIRRDPARFAAFLGLPADRVAPFFVDAEAGASPGGLPQGGETLLAFTNNHLQYALTWYGLAAVLVVVVGLFVRGRLR
ncbi:MAG: SURF1 family protein [Hyphomicrobiales bacterium]|nr:SURF1 family protein [Hyphomicrobiales bacterium]